MKKAAQLFIIIGSVLLLQQIARGETMEERKLRIERKYLMKQQKVEQIDLGVYELAPDDELEGQGLLAEGNDSDAMTGQGVRRSGRIIRRTVASGWDEGDDTYAENSAEQSDELANRREALWGNWNRLQSDRRAAANQTDPYSDYANYTDQGYYDNGYSSYGTYGSKTRTTYGAQSTSSYLYGDNSSLTRRSSLYSTTDDADSTASSYSWSSTSSEQSSSSYSSSTWPSSTTRSSTTTRTQFQSQQNRSNSRSSTGTTTTGRTRTSLDDAFMDLNNDH